MDTKWLPDIADFDGPKYLALTHALRDAVRAGDLPEGTRLLPVRELAWSLGVTPGTVARAYQIATREGLLEAVVGRGTFVAARSPSFGPTQPLMTELMPAANRDLVDLRSPQLAEVGQGDAISAIMIRLAGHIGQDFLEYPSLRRDQPLRAAYAQWLSDRDLGAFGAEDIALTMGGQNAINIVLQCCLRGDRPQVYAEELAYPGFRHAARLNRADVIAVPLDDQGMSAEELDQACRRHGGRIVCLTTEAQNPTTIRMSLERRQAIVEVARRHDLQIIEDDCYSAAVSNIPSLRALAPERVWHVTSLSKSVSAGLRFGAVVCPTGRGEAGRLAAQHSYFGLARPMIEIVYALLSSGEAVRLRARVWEVFDRRLEIALNLLGRYDVAWQKGLSFLWLKLPIGWRASTFAREAEMRGVLIRSADEYALLDGQAPNAVRIALAGGVGEAQFTRAIETLARLLDSPPGDLPV